MIPLRAVHSNAVLHVHPQRWFLPIYAVVERAE